MLDTESLKQRVEEKFIFLKDGVRIQRAKRLWAEVPRDEFFNVFDYIVKELGFTMLCTITGLDDGDSIGLIYHLATETGAMFNLKTRVIKEGVFKTITAYFPGGNIYEREIVDLLGIKFDGLAISSRYPLPDGWPAGQYPLRKDWKVEMLEAGGKV